jgi:hypothetical protein
MYMSAGPVDTRHRDSPHKVQADQGETDEQQTSLVRRSGTREVPDSSDHEHNHCGESKHGCLREKAKARQSAAKRSAGRGADIVRHTQITRPQPLGQTSAFRRVARSAWSWLRVNIHRLISQMS